MLRGNERVLLVDDQSIILDSVRPILAFCGYTVLFALSPEKAIQIAEQHSDEIDILITDITMPGMNGRELAGYLLASYPGMKCLYMSAFSDAVIHDLPGAQFIQKPFSASELSSKVREVLDH